MNEAWWVIAIGMLAQLLFSLRIPIQWIKSEKLKKVVSPTLFWRLSLAASSLLFLYGWLRDDFAILLGQLINYAIYIRNLQLKDDWKRFPLLLRAFLLLLPAVILIYGLSNGRAYLTPLFTNAQIPPLLLAWGVVAQVIFALRFVYQWIYSERQGKSVLPTGFWILSLSGGMMMLLYAILRKDPVIFIGQSIGSFVYGRNLILYRKYGTS